MCMEDVRLGRKTQALTYTVMLPAGVVEIVPYNKKRIALAIGVVPGTANIGISMDPNMGVNTGMTIDGTGNPFLVNVQHHGRMAIGPWYSGSGPGIAVYITETLLSDD